MTPEDFKKLIFEKEFDDILSEILLSADAKHVSPENQYYIKDRLAKTFKVDIQSVNLIIVGSAKLGFSITEKRTKEGATLPRYRAFRAESDIDIAIICTPIYEAIWNELSKFAFSKPYSPWDSGKLGDYLVYGWLRPDYFPSERLRKCDDWWDLFRYLSSQYKLGRRRIRGGLFYNFDQLKSYQAKSLTDCIDFEKIQP